LSHTKGTTMRSPRREAVHLGCVMLVAIFLEQRSRLIVRRLLPVLLLALLVVISPVPAAPAPSDGRAFYSPRLCS
jgi:hypothetical protein